MNYQEWINREQRLRINILQSSPLIRKDKIFRVCKECKEVCLCHEDTCPNCNSLNISNQTLNFEDNPGCLEARIRCRYRFMCMYENGRNNESFNSSL